MIIDWALLLAALIAVESGGDTKAIGDNGRAHGCLQIHEIMVDDVNRILATKKYAGKGEPYRFTYRDRKFESTSRSMAVIYLRHYGGENMTYERLARLWNGGPKGPTKSSTDKYWVKVSAELDRIRKEQ